MKKRDFIELKGKDLKELRKMVSERKLEASKAKMAVSGGKEKNLKLPAKYRSEIAKILTLIREKEILESLAPKKEVKEEKK